jgi:hypothetical protein
MLDMTERQKAVLCAVGFSRLLDQNSFETREQFFSFVEKQIKKMREGAKIDADVMEIFAGDSVLESMCKHLHG